PKSREAGSGARRVKLSAPVLRAAPHGSVLIFDMDRELVGLSVKALAESAGIATAGFLAIGEQETLMAMHANSPANATEANFTLGTEGIIVRGRSRTPLKLRQTEPARSRRPVRKPTQPSKMCGCDPNL